MIEVEMNKLKEFGIDLDKCKEYQVLCLPENIEDAAPTDDLFDASGTSDLYKILKSNGLKCANSFDLGIETGVLDRRAGDIWLGLVWIMDNLAIPTFVGVVSALIASKIKRNPKSTTPTIQRSEPKIHLDLRILQGKELTLEYDGNPETLIQILNSIKEDNEIL